MAKKTNKKEQTVNIENEKEILIDTKIDSTENFNDEIKKHDNTKISEIEEKVSKAIDEVTNDVVEQLSTIKEQEKTLLKNIEENPKEAKKMVENEMKKDTLQPCLRSAGQYPAKRFHPRQSPFGQSRCHRGRHA